jgi:hypothetical protein
MLGVKQFNKITPVELIQLIKELKIRKQSVNQERLFKKI